MADSNKFYSEEAQEIFGKTPSWITQWGITIILLTFLGIIVIGNFIQFPERIKGIIIIKTENLPINIVSQQSAKIDTIFVKTNDNVKRNDLLAILHSEADYNDVLFIEKHLLSDADTIVKLVSEKWILGQYKLDVLNEEWIAFSQSCLRYHDFIKQDAFYKQQQILKKQINNLEERYNQICARIEYEKSNEKGFIEDSIPLFLQKASDVCACRTANNLVTSYIEKKLLLESSIIDKEEELFKISIMHKQKIETLEEIVLYNKEKLIDRIKVWKSSHELRSSVDGRVNRVEEIITRDTITPNDIIFSITPPQEINIVGEMKVPQGSIDEVKVGQSVNVKLHGYPFLKYGFLKGRVCYISPIPVKTTKDSQIISLYTVKIQFRNDMITTYNKRISLLSEMSGEAEIVTAKRKFITRILEPFISLFSMGI